jgi:hypothetical protein
VRRASGGDQGKSEEDAFHRFHSAPHGHDGVSGDCDVGLGKGASKPGPSVGFPDRTT